MHRHTNSYYGHETTLTVFITSWIACLELPPPSHGHTGTVRAVSPITKAGEFHRLRPPSHLLGSVCDVFCLLHIDAPMYPRGDVQWMSGVLVS